MPDFQENHDTFPTEPGNFSLPMATIETKIMEGNDVLNDFTGSNAIRFPAVLATLTNEQYQAFVMRNRQWLVYTRAGMQPQE